MKKAILVVSFGTSYHETRKKTIEACENKIKESFKDYDFYRAFTSGMIINKLKKRDNMFIDNPSEALEKLYNAGYQEVVVQSLHIICGDEYNKLKDMVAQYEDKFDKISIGRPLLTYIDDYRESPALKLIDLLKKENAEVDFFDPYIPEYRYFGKTYKGIEKIDPMILGEYDLIVIATAHKSYDLEMIQKSSKAIFDSRNAMKDIADKSNIELL